VESTSQIRPLFSTDFSLDKQRDTTILLCYMLPPFDSAGNLPPGIYEVSWDELEVAFATNAHRQRLLAGFRAVAKKLTECGCERVYLDGSFVTSEPVPADFDGAWELSGVDLRKLLSSEPLLFDFTNRRAAQKAKYLGEMFPADVREASSGRTFIDFFQQDKTTGTSKGIVAIQLRTIK